MCSSRFTGVHSEVACKIYSLSLSRVRQRGLRVEGTRRVGKTNECEEGVGRQGDPGKEWEGREM